jgi:hypothetical protein
MKTRHQITAEYDDGIEIVIEFSFSPGRPGSFYKRNGDPGDPPEPDSIDFVSAHRWPKGDCTPAEEAWASDWLAEHEDDAAEVAWTDRIEEEDRAEEALMNGQFGAGA